MPPKNSSSVRDKERKALTFIRDFIHTKGYSPTLREIADGCGITSTSVMRSYIDRLEQHGKIIREPHISRGIRLVDNHAAPPSADSPFMAVPALLDEVQRLRQGVELAITYIEGNGNTFSEREKTPLLFQLRQLVKEKV